ncbi:MAG: histidine--tRNA ligase [Pseudomonadota bacterium]|nr:histidine--tRNA ligase [Pseudomonadota bacterium]
MTNKKNMTPVGGFPEYLPEIHAVEQSWTDRIRKVFEASGYAPIETVAVERLDALLAKGETDKEIYTLTRLQAEEDENAKLGLHFDLTIPVARYVAQNFNDLTFPFKRYQIQKVWRGERPQVGRYREFRQCDIDVINVDNLPLHFDAEMPEIVAECLMRLDLPPVTIGIGNRKILDGYLQGLGIEDTVSVIRIIDKLDKIGFDEVIAELTKAPALDPDTARRAMALTTIKTADTSFAKAVHAIGVTHPLLDEGIEELAFVIKELAHLPADAIQADLSIARGFDYYTGTVYEARFKDFPGAGAIVAGGRYDNLASQFINKKLPGVGISIGLSRMFGQLLAKNLIAKAQQSPSQVLVIWPRNADRECITGTARILRARGIRTECYHAPVKIQRQIAYAEKKGIPFVWFPPFEPGSMHEVKDMKARTQSQADIENWEPSK